jgi:phosphatidylserine decarboxylase
MPVVLGGGLAVLVCAVIPGMWWLSVLFAILTFACVAFYRDFNRPIPREAGVMVAPADGKVTEITKLERYGPFGGPALKVSIFLSVLDVHVNRAPCDGTVLWTRYEEGLFLDARHPDCSSKNQSNTICIGAVEGGGERPIAVVKQIVGAIARRIIAPVAPGERFTRGQRFGMIAFGSRTELYVPGGEWEVAVALGTHVKGGKDVLLRAVR